MFTTNTDSPMQQQQTGSLLVTIFFAVSSHVFHDWAHILGGLLGNFLSYSAAIVAICSGIVTMSPSLRAAVDARFKKWLKL